MQYPIPWRYGQVKPFGSIPRLNLAHPLVRGHLTFYGYDTGTGVVVDLVSGAKGVITGTGTQPVMATSPFGSGWNYKAAAASKNIVFPIMPSSVNAANNAAFTAICGFCRTGAYGGTGFANIFASDDGGANDVFDIALASTTQMEWSLDNTSTGGPLTIMPALNTFATAYQGAPSTAASAGFFGVITGNNTVTSGTFTHASVTSASERFCLGGGASSNLGGYVGFVFYGACWTGGYLTAGDRLNLHLDPWSMLWYPEDEIFAELVGTTASNILLGQMWM